MSNQEGSGSPPRSKPAGWVWALGGCGGCLLLVLIIAGVLGGIAYNAYVSQKVGPLTPATVQQKLGPSVPLYPGAVLNVPATDASIRSTGVMTRVFPGMSKEVKFSGLGVFTTQDSPQKVMEFYDTRLPALGWQRAQSINMGFQQQNQYRKGHEMLSVQTQDQSRAGHGTILTLMRYEGKGVDKVRVRTTNP